MSQVESAAVRAAAQTGKRRVMALVLTGAVAMGLMAGDAAAQEAILGPITAKGHEPMHGSFSVLPWESIDMLSGSLVLTNIDLTLPGYNGMDLQVGRVMNRGGDGPNTWWNVGVVGPTAVTLGDTVNPNPTIESWDGGVEYTFGTADPDVFMTLRYGRFTRSTRVLELPDGTICEFEHRVNDTVYLITSRSDQFGNGIEYNYDTPNVVEVTQYLGAEENAQRRRVTIDKTGTNWYVYWSYRDPAGIYHRQTTWQYQRDSAQRIYSVIPPEEPGWSYQYDSVSDTVHRLTVTTPEGGTVSYVSELQDCPPPPHQTLYQRFAVRERSAGGRDIPAATWTFRYDETWTAGPGSFYGWVTLPRQGDEAVTTVTYVHSRYSVGENYNLRSPLKEVTISRGALLERRTYHWDESVPPPWAPINFNSLPDSPLVEIGRPYLIRWSTVLRDGITYRRDYSYCGDSGQPACLPAFPYDGGWPRKVTESGDFERVYTYSYHYPENDESDPPPPYLLGRVTREAVRQTGAAGEFVTTNRYDNLGFRLDSNVRGVVTTYTPDSHGNVDHSRLPNDVDDDDDLVVTYAYDWGVVTKTTTPEYTETKTINPDGTAAELSRDAAPGEDIKEGSGAKQSWVRDALGRVTTETPRTADGGDGAGAPTVTDYDALAEGRIVSTRHTSRVTQYMDGYGRSKGTSNSVGVKTAIDYDVMGRVEKESAPFEGDPRPSVVTRLTNTTLWVA